MSTPNAAVTGTGTADHDAWPAPAKLNLFLHITGRRADGYHNLQTVFQFLDYADELAFQPRSDSRVTLAGNDPAIPADRDLAVRAAHALQAETGTGLGVDIRLHKRLPIGGGVGGGSSNAATTLVALDWLWGLGLGTERLARLGLGLGADVPVFVYGRAAWAEGVGEVLTPVEPAEDWYVVANPGVHLSTAEVFNAPDLTRNSPAITIRDFLGGAGRNDCEALVRRTCPEVDRLISWMEAYAPARLTGTGSCVFCRFDDAQQANELVANLPQPWQGFVARGRNRSPLLDKLDRVTRAAAG